MEDKKNKFIFTIGFNSHDSNHVKVVELLNQIGRCKAQLIVNAVLAYNKTDNSGIDYEVIESIVHKILEKERIKQSDTPKKHIISKDKPESKETGKNTEKEIGDNVLDAITQSLDSFRRDI